MADKEPPTLIIEVDLGNQCSYRKIQKILCDLQIPEQIKSISYDDKKNTVTISGPFDPDKLTKKIYCKASKVCLSIVIKPPSQPPSQPPPKPPPPEPCKVINCIRISVGGHKVGCPMVKCKEPPKSCHQPDCPVCCCVTRCHVGGHGGSSCCSCGKCCSCGECC